MRLRIIGLGSHHGDDAAGPLVARRLAESSGLPGEIDAVECRRPLDLIDLLSALDGAVLVDATRSGRPPGTVHEPRLDQLLEARPLSSHGIGLREALAMARALDRAPRRIAVVGIEAAATEGEGLSRAVRAALAEAARRAHSRCTGWLAEGASPRLPEAGHA